MTATRNQVAFDYMVSKRDKGVTFSMLKAHLRKKGFDDKSNQSILLLSMENDGFLFYIDTREKLIQPHNKPAYWGEVTVYKPFKNCNTGEVYD